MKPLSAVVYLKNNYKKLLPSLVCMSFGVFLIYFFSILLYSGVYGMNQGYLNILEKATSVSSNTKDPISDKVLNKIKESDNVQYIIPIINDIGQFRYKSPFGQIWTEAYNVFEEDIPQIINVFDLKLVKGKFPSSNSNEILIPLKISKQNKIEIGDYIGKNPDLNINLNKKYKVCGMVDGIANIMLTANPANVNREEIKQHSLIFSLKDRKNQIVNDEITSIKDKKVTIMDYKFGYNQMNEILEIMNFLRFILNFIVIIVLCISLGNLNYILFLNRKDEFAILATIGYKKKTLFIKLLKENIIVNLMSFAIGILFNIIVIKLLNIVVYEPKGQYIYSFNINSIITAFLIPLIVSISNMIAPLKNLKKMDCDSINI